MHAGEQESTILCSLYAVPSIQLAALRYDSASCLACCHEGNELWQAALTRVVEGQTRKGPLRYLERITVDKVRLGRRPPTLSSCAASTGADNLCLRLVLPFSFEPTEGFSVVVRQPVTSLIHMLNSGTASAAFPCMHGVFWPVLIGTDQEGLLCQEVRASLQ